MSDTGTLDRLAALSPEQRELLEILRRKKAALAANTAKRSRRPPAAPPIPRRPAGPGSWPLSFDQERLWFLYYLDPEATAYNIDTSTRMRGRLDVPALVRALNVVIRRHEAWRTTFHAVDGRPVQTVAPELTLDVSVVDLRRVPSDRREAVTRAHQRSEARRPFDLSRGPLVRSLLLRLEDDLWTCMLTVHHIVTDWVTFQLFWRELAILYTAEVEPAAPPPFPLPEIPRQYADFAVWQREWLKGEVLDAYLDFWLQELADVPQVLELPLDRPRPATQTTRGGEQKVEIPGARADALKALAREVGASPFMAVLAVWKALLFRLTGQEKVLIGSPNANRNQVELEPAFGFFLTQLVFATDGAGDPTFRELLSRVRRGALGAYAHQDLPFGKLLEALKPERDNSRPPLVQANFLLLDSEYTPMALPDLEVVPIWVDDGNSRFDMTLGLWDSPQRIFGFFEYNLDLFDRTTVARMGEAFEAISERVVADPELRLSDLPLLSTAARHQVLAEWNGIWEGGEGKREPAVPVLLAARAAERPEALAVVCGETALTHGDLDRAAEREAGRLRAAGIGKGDVVGLALDRSAALAVGVLAIWKAGAVLLPLDPAAPKERLAFLVEDAGARAILTREPLRPRLPPTGLPILFLGGSQDAPSGATTEIGPGDAAYLIYTSGTTGQPKGVVVEHGNLAALLAACQLEFAFTAADRLLSVAPFSFDIFFFELLSPLLAGGTTEILAATSPLDLEALLAGLEQATRFHAVPALLRQILPALPRQGAAPFAGLRTLFLGGDAVPADLVAGLAAALPGVELRVLYGPTEATILASSERVERVETARDLALRVGTPLGRPLPGVRLRVIDPTGGLAAIGVAGELWIGGAGVTRGYLGRDELTRERFVTAGGLRWYRTGDRVRLRADGALEFLGRVDAQLKIRGFRVEPGEVEAALRDLPGVAEAAVVAREVAGGDKQLVAYVVPRPGREPGELRAETLGERLRERLPGHMVPSLFVPLAALPLTSHGKVDTKALPDPAAALAGEAGRAEPRNEREAVLAGVWREVLGLPRVGIHDNFFQLGGDSILSIQMVARARRDGLLLTPKQLFEHQTVAGLAAVAGQAGETGVDQAPVTGEAPLTPIERRFFAEERPEPWRFNQALLFASRAALDPRLLTLALDTLVDHHDALRLRFTEDGESWKQWHAPAGMGAPLLAVDLFALPPERTAEAIEAAVEALQGAFDLGDIRHGPLFLAALFQGGPGGDDRLLLTAHHLVVDGVSWRILLEDLETAYRRLAAGEAPELPAKTTSFQSWAERLAAHARSAEVRAELRHWTSLPAAPPLPVDFPGGDNRAGTAASVSVELAAEETRALLREAPAAYRTRVDELLLAALARALATFTGSERVLLDVEGHGREEALVDPAGGLDLSRTVGWFTTLYPVALDLRGAAEPGAAIKAVKEQLRAVPGKGLGYGLLRWLGDEKIAARLAPAPDVSFNYLGQADPSLAEAALLSPAPEAIRGTESPRARRAHLLEVSGIVLGERLRLDLTYSTALHRPETAESLAQGFLAELRTLLAHCLSPGAFGYTPADFPLARLSQGELDALLGAERGIEDLYPLAPLQQGMLFHTLFTPGSELYFEQLTATLRGALDLPAFTRAWQRVLDRHPALRTAFLWEGLPEPLQTVRRGVTLEWELLDWRDAGSAEEQERRFTAKAAADRRRGFDLARPPLLRLALARTGPSEHRLLWSFHHLLFDGWCFSLLFSEVFTLYAGFAERGEEPPLPPVHPYSDYIAWLERRDPGTAESFWRRALAGFAAPTPLPLDRPASPPGVAAADYRESEITLGEAGAVGVGAMAELAQRLAVTQNVLLQAAWALLLSRFAREADIAFGTVVSGRPADLPGVESIVGLFINTVPVRVQIPAGAGESLAAWLGRLREAQAERSQNEWTPLARIQAASEVPPGEPLFASLLVFENYPLDPGLAAGVAGLAIDSVAVSERTNYALTLTAAARGGDLSLRLLHDRRTEPATARRLLGHLAVLLEGMAVDPERAPADLPLLRAAERQQLLGEWVDEGETDPEVPSVLASFAARAAEDPGALAVSAPDGELSYGELASRAERLARRLLAGDLPPGSVVGLAVGRTTALPVGILGILQAGAAWVPLDPRLPAERLAFLLADSGARAVVAERATAASLPAGDLPVLLAGKPGDAADAAAVVDAAPGPLPRVSRGDLAYVLYTSGTTGKPKGVMVEHGSLARVLAASARFLGWGRDERVLAVAPFSFDISIWELLKPLTLGAAVEIFPLEPVPDLAQLTLTLRRATRMHAVPALLRQIAEAVRAAGGAWPHLRSLYMGGEAAPAELQAELLDLFPGIDLRVLYGPTEGTIFCTGARSLPGELRSAPLGRPLPGARLRLADPTGLPLPAGAAGELWLSGIGLARGYLGRPDLTAERFVPGPGGERWYRTGDLARRRPEGTDGELDFLGRTDDQVKVRGVRMELGEIEAALRALPEVREAAVLALPGDRGGRGDRRLAAFVVSGEGECDPDRLAQGLRRSLPEAMVPAVFAQVAALPRTAHGKLDRKALAQLAPPELPSAGGAGAAPPRNAVEAALAAVWRSVLGVERVGIDDNFFRLGGDSILSLQVVSRARQAGLVFTPRQLFEHPTIAGLAKVAASARPGGAEQEPITGEAPLTPIQHHFFTTQEGAHLQHFAQAVLLDLAAAGPVAPPLLARALAALADHHDALRLRFTPPGESAEGGWRQAHGPAGEAVPFLAVDLSALPEPRFGAAVTAAAEALEAGFDIASGPLFLGALLTGGPGRRRLLLAAHHLVVDTVSWRVLLEDLETAWTQLAAGSPVRLPEKTTSYKAWATGLTVAAASSDLAADREHWLALAAALESEAPLALPAGLAAAAGPIDTVSVALSQEATEALLRRAPSAYRTRVDDLLLTALALALGVERGERGPLLVHLEGHGREDELVPGADLSRTVGWFTSIYPVALDLRGAAGPGEAIRRVKETLRQIPHKGAGYGLLRHLGSAAERERLARFERAHPAAVAWNYLGQLDSPFAGSSRLRLAPEPTGTGQSPEAPREHPLEVNAMVLDGRLRAEWSFTHIPGIPAARQAALRLSAAFLEALETLVEHCLSPAAGGYTPSDFPLAALDQGDLDDLLGAARDIEDLYPLTPLQQGMLFHDLYAPGSGLYVQQLACTLVGPLDRAAFHAAWQAVVDRHPVLRTAFLWQGLARPLQAVHAGVALPWEDLDLRGTPASEGAELPERLAALASGLRDRGFDPGRAPLLRMTLVRTGEEEHRFFWTFHHILLDGWCFALLFRDLFALYENRAAELPPAPPYRDYIAWLERRATAAAAAAERYWRGALAGFAVPTPLPLDRPLAAEGEGGGDLELFVPAEQTAGLQALARASELTVNTLFQGAWALLLSRYIGGRGGGAGDVVFGTVVSGRPPELPGVETMVGLFINTLPVRLAPDPAMPAGAFLREVQARQVEMLQHEHAPLADVQRSSDVPPGEPLFQSLFVFENFPVDSSLGQGAGDLAIRDVCLEDRADYPVGIAAGPADGGRRVGLRITYDGHLEAPTVERLGRHLIALLAGFAEGGADRPLGDIPLLSAAERRQLLVEWGRGPAVQPEETCLHTLFAEQAARTPGALAIVQGGQGERRISYGELDRAAAALARRLRELGVGPEVEVPLLAGRSPEAIVGIVAILAAGGAYVPLDPATPTDRLALLLDEIRGGAPTLPLVATADAASRLPVPGTAAGDRLLPVLLDDVLASPAPEATLRALPPSGAGPESLAYVLYTSGSTGTPKGVMVSHRSIVAYIRAVVAFQEMGPGDSELQASAFTFDPSLEEIFAPLASGGAVVLPEGPFEEPVRFLDFCRRTEVTILSLPTAYWHTFVATLTAESLPVPPRVRRIIMGGERALPERWAAWGEGEWARVPLVNGYGPTEATVVATVETHPGPGAALSSWRQGREVPIGRPLPGVLVRVLAGLDSPEPLPPGAVGELHLGGVSLARGYLDHPALTAERFVPDPWPRETPEPGARLYRTGDLVRFLPDGRLEFLGRSDAQVKVRGFRIELGEVEAALAAHPAVLEAAAGTRTDASGSQSLVAWVVPRGGERLEPESLRQFLAGRLPAYMIPAPSDIAFLPALPKNASDKVDRHALAQLAPAPRTDGERYVAPRNAMEEELAGLFREILGVDQVGATDDFFALGGHSLLATQLVSRLRRHLGVDLPLARLFELRTLESIASEVLARKLATEGEQVDDLLADLDNLTDEEALALLAAEDEGGDGKAEAVGEAGGEEARP